MSSDTVAAVPQHPNFNVWTHPFAYEYLELHSLGFSRERMSLISIAPSKNELDCFIIYYENSLIEN